MMKYGIIGLGIACAILVGLLGWTKYDNAQLKRENAELTSMNAQLTLDLAAEKTQTKVLGKRLAQRKTNERTVNNVKTELKTYDDGPVAPVLRRAIELDLVPSKTASERKYQPRADRRSRGTN